MVGIGPSLMQRIQQYIDRLPSDPNPTLSRTCRNLIETALWIEETRIAKLGEIADPKITK